MGSGDIVVGKNTSGRKSKPVSPENFAKRAGASSPAQSIPAKEERHCGAMSLQRDDNGTMSTPQKFVRLVGCRDAKPRPRGGS